MHSRLRGMSPWCCDKDFVYSFARRSWILSIWKLENYICIVVNLLTGITEAQTCMRLSWIVSVVNIFIYLFLLLWLRIFFQGEKEDSDEMIGTERATSLSSEEVALDQRTGMIGPATDSDDEEVLVILRSMKSAVSHFVGYKKIFQRMRVERRSLQKKVIISRSLKSFVSVFNELTRNKWHCV